MLTQVKPLSIPRLKDAVAIGVICLGFLLLAPSGQASQSTEKQFIYTFANGNKLVTIPGKGVFFRKKKADLLSGKPEDLLIADSPRIEQFPETETLKKSQWVSGLKETDQKEFSAWVRHYGSGTALAIFEAGPHIYAVNQGGNSIRLLLPEISYNHVKFSQNNIENLAWNWTLHDFTYGNQSYVAFSIQQEHDANRGIALFIREDLKTVYLGDHLFLKKTIQFDGTRISFEGLNFEFDLKDFDRANTRVPRKTNQDAEVLDEEGEKSIASKIVHKNFPDFGKSVRDSQVTFSPLNPDELKDFRRALVKKQNGNVLITGDAGSGKTELLRAFVKEVLLGNIPEIPAWTEFLLVDSTAIDAGARYTGTYDARLNALVKYAQGNDVVLVLDEAHTLRGSGAHSQNSNDFFQRIKPYLADGSIRMIGTTTDDEYDAAFSGDLALARRIVRIQKKPIPVQMIDSILVTWATKMGYEPLTPELRKQVQLISKEFDAVGLEAVKALRLLDEFYADLTIDGKTPTQAQKEDLQKVAVRLYNMDPAYFDPQKRFTLINDLAKGLDQSIIHQTDLKTALVDDTLRSLMGTTDLSKPKIRRLFAGPKGLGKTHAAKAYAKHMKLPFVRINLGEYAGKKPEDLLREVGSALRKNAFTVILFDEVEKAPRQIQEALLGVLDSDSFTMQDSLNGVNSSSGPKTFSKVRTTNASIFLATNAGQNQLMKHVTLSPSELRTAIVNDGFSEFLLDRCREVHAFLPPQTKEEFIEVIKSHLSMQLEQLAEQKGVRLSVPNETEFLSSIADKYFDPSSGYRPALAEIQDVVSLALARKLLLEPESTSCSLLLTSKSPDFGAREAKKIGFR